MKNKIFILGVLLVFLIPLCAYSASEHSYKSKYVGQEKREIKSLSESDIEELENGKGWGFAKAAELNGVPGPIHLLEMKKEIKLSSEQIQKIQALYQKMRKQAIPLGQELIELERRLNNHFANRTITENLLHELLGEIVQVRKKLRYAHLSAHLNTPDILTPEQITLYNELRGYSSNNPCKNIPEGHDPAMWKKHHNCP
jgi:Spy/CpxP family protein refolding chaperone